MNPVTLLAWAAEAHRMDVYPDARFPPSVYYRFLRVVAREKRPKLSVELGVCGGGASLHMAIGYPSGIVVGIDRDNPYPDNIEYVQQTCKNFEFRQMDSIDAVQLIAHPMRGYGGVDVLFIDTVHTYDRTMLEFHAWRPYLAKDALVMLDDLFREGMDQVWGELPGSKLRMDDLHLGGSPTDGGFGVIYGLD